MRFLLSNHQIFALKAVSRQPLNMSSFVSLLLFLITLSPMPLLAADYEKVTERKLFNGDSVSELKLPNGLRVLLVPRHQAKVLSYQTWFIVGSIDEKLDPKLKKTGLAHLFEHMMFRGTEKYADGKFDEITARIGGDKQNATTYYYRTNYFENIPSSQLETLMEIEADRMRNLKLTSDTFEKEKGAVVGELRRHLDTPYAIAQDELMRIIFGVSPYRWTVLGTEEEIKGFSLEEAQYFYKTFYAPNNCTLIVVGDILEGPLMKLVSKFYGKMQSQEIPPRAVPEEPPQKKSRRFEGTHHQATSEILLVAYRIPPISSPDIVPLALLATHLSTGMESRLRKVLVDTGIAVSASASVSSQPDLFELSVQLAESHRAEEAQRIIEKEVESLRRNPIRKEAFERALNQELLSLYSDITDNSSLANFFGEYLALSGNYMRGFEIIEAYRKIGPAELQKVAKNYFRGETKSSVFIRPEKKAKT